MTRKLLSLLTPLALLLLVGFGDPSFVDEDEDYYLQEMLTRERYNQVKVKPKSSTADTQEEPKQNPARKIPKGEVGNDKKTDRISDSTKSGKGKQLQTVLHGKVKFPLNLLL